MANNYVLKNQELQFRQHLTKVQEEKEKLHDLALVYRRKKKSDIEQYKHELLKMYDLLNRYAEIMSDISSGNMNLLTRSGVTTVSLPTKMSVAMPTETHFQKLFEVLKETRSRK